MMRFNKLKLIMKSKVMYQKYHLSQTSAFKVNILNTNPKAHNLWI